MDIFILCMKSVLLKDGGSHQALRTYRVEQSLSDVDVIK